MRRMALGLFGGLLVVAGIAGQIVAGSHRPAYHATGWGYFPVDRTGWATGTYDAVRIGAWALIVFGAVVVAFALVRELRVAREAPSTSRGRARTQPDQAPDQA